MEKRINVAELLKDCPKGMELDCAIWDDVKFNSIKTGDSYPICIKVGEEYKHLTEFGHWDISEHGKCVIFPKGKTTWKGFQRPFKDGEIVALDSTKGVQIFIFKEYINAKSYCARCYMMLDDDGTLDIEGGDYHVLRLATEEEKEKLYKVIKNHGYTWNAGTKTLEKLVGPKFKVGDRIKRKGDTRLTTIKGIRDEYYIITFPDLWGHAYITDKLLSSNQDEYEIIPNKFDITTLKPFDRVLVRGDVGQKWTHDFFGFMDKDKGYPFVCVGHYVIQCIPYEGNEHLLGKTDDCAEYYKT